MADPSAEELLSPGAADNQSRPWVKGQLSQGTADGLHFPHEILRLRETALDYTPGLNPVSYTHLRAHETRHDLVCRLLLEKKKKTNKHSDSFNALAGDHESTS
eukprot:TRINITY_DN11008_c0_g2_i1.p5 TRINITY_DN11008_c0_g2~~TRINITY_DN11008_c0_g2_i1.p5  ORF type:complete len:103 (-),score=5.68 TRINITY_DN11008_c0_g2_i1:21-329(-)